MPGRSYNKVEAKYNVTTDFPSLGLHSAAATANLGLVEYALLNGQPVNSVLDGVLPLHAACAGGHTQVVKLLIEWGADVNAPRLPRRYSNDKNRDSSAPIVGSSGSTPLHFAAANGNTNVVSLLLLHGAHADRPDKHGVTPEMLAKQNGWLECAQVLREWILNKDRDLKERETMSGLPSSRSRDADLSGADAELSASPPRRRLQVKHSIDTALNMFKSSSSLIDPHVKSSSRCAFLTSTPPASPTRPLELATRDDSLVGSARMSPVEHDSRRPSLPHLFPPPPRTRQVSNPSSNAPFNNSRRPRSAGTDAEHEEEEAQSTLPINISGKRLGSKYSLMNMFRKAHSDTPSGNIAMPDFRPGSSPKQAPTVQGSQATPSNLSVPSQAAKLAHDIKKDKDSVSHRFHRGSDASTQSQPCSSSPRSTDRRNLPNLDDTTPSDDTNTSTHKRDAAKSSSPVSMLSILKGKGHNRERSCSNGSSYSFQSRYISCSRDEIPAMIEGESSRGISRSGILLGHNRSPSSGQSTPLSSSYKALRFEYSLNDPEDSRGTGQLHGLRSVNSAGSLARAKTRQGDVTQTNRGSDGAGRTDLPPMSAPVVVPHFGSRADGASFEVRTPSHHDRNVRSPFANATFTRRRGLSFLSSSSDTSASLLAGNDGLINETHGINIGTPSRSLPSISAVPPVSPSGMHASASNDGSRTSKSDRGFSGRSIFEIDFRTISSHAEAEALVQQTQKEILEMGEQEILLNSESAGNTPLSARLAAYGESLALERKLREEMESRPNGRSSPSANGFSTIGQTQSHLKIIRQHSLDDKLGNRKEMYRQMHFQRSSKVQVLDGGPENGEQDQLHSRPATSLGYNHHASNSTHLMGFDTLDQASPIDSLERDLEFGSSLYRVSTTPLSSTANSDRTTIEQARNVKLTKMGFAPNEQASRLPPAQTKVFGGLNFKNLFKGRA